MTIEQYARAVAEATRKYLYVTQTADVPMLDDHDLRAIIASVPKPPGIGVCCMCDAEIPVACKDCIDYARESVGLPAPDVQAPVCRVDGCGAVATTHLCGDHVAPIDDAARREDHLLDALEKLQAQIDAARADEREATCLRLVRVLENCLDSERQSDGHTGEQALEAALQLVKQRAADGARAEERNWLENRLREVATLYSHGSDGRNTLLLLADQIRARSARGV